MTSKKYFIENGYRLYMGGFQGYESFRNISVKGLFGNIDFDIAFKEEGSYSSQLDPLKLIYGSNGQGKTTVLKIINSLLTGDIETLLTIPFKSLEIERVEQWGPSSGLSDSIIYGGSERGRHLGLIPGMEIWFTSSKDNDFSHNFGDEYNYIKFIGPGWYGPHWREELDSPENMITLEQRNLILQFLSEREELRDFVEGMSEDDNVFEFQIAPLISHTFKLEWDLENGNGLIAEYVQDRSPNASRIWPGEDWKNDIDSLMSALGVSETAIKALTGSELLARGHFDIEQKESIKKFMIHLKGKGIGLEHVLGDPLQMLSFLEAEDINLLVEKRAINIEDIKQAWMAFQGARDYWDGDSKMLNFDDMYNDWHSDVLTPYWGHSFEDILHRQTVTNVIHIGSELGDRGKTVRMVEKLQDSLQRRRLGEKGRVRKVGPLIKQIMEKEGLKKILMGLVKDEWPFWVDAEFEEGFLESAAEDGRDWKDGFHWEELRYVVYWAYILTKYRHVPNRASFPGRVEASPDLSHLNEMQDIAESMRDHWEGQWIPWPWGKWGEGPLPGSSKNNGDFEERVLMEQWGDTGFNPENRKAEIEREYFPFFEEINGMLHGKSLKVDDRLSTIVVSNWQEGEDGEGRSNSIIPFSKLSHGELRLMHILSAAAHDPYTPMPGRFANLKRWPTILIDEPESGLHISWQREIVPIIKRFYALMNESEAVTQARESRERYRRMEEVRMSIAHIESNLELTKEEERMLKHLKSQRDGMDRANSEDNRYLVGHPTKMIIATHSPEIVGSSPEDSVVIEGASGEPLRLS